MAGPLYGTEYVAMELDFIRGDSSDVVNVGIYLDVNPNFSPEEADFTIVQLVEPPNPLAEAAKIDILARVGPRVGADLDPAPGDYQVWGMVTTTDEAIIRKCGTLEVL